MVPFNPILKIADTSLKRLTNGQVIKPFDCNNPDLNDFLTKDSLLYLNFKLQVTYILETPDKTIAYFSLENDLIKIDLNELTEFKSELRDITEGNPFLYQLFQRNTYPAVKIGRLAVHKDFQCQGIGTELLNAIKVSLVKNNKTGCAFLTVDAINEDKPLKFYERNGFDYLTIADFRESSRLMYLCLMGMI